MCGLPPSPLETQKKFKLERLKKLSNYLDGLARNSRAVYLEYRLIENNDIDKIIEANRKLLELEDWTINNLDFVNNLINLLENK